MFKEVVMKTLIYEISRLRNLQYDSELFFQEIEKFHDSTDLVSNISLNSNLGLSSIKENFQKTTSVTHKSYLKNVADKISKTHRLNLKKDNN